MSARAVASPRMPPPTIATSNRSAMARQHIITRRALRPGGSPMAGKYFDELQVGQKFQHQPGRTVTESDNVFFSCLTMNPQPLHVDFHAAAQAEFGKPLVNSILTLGIAVGLSVGETTLGTTVGNLGFGGRERWVRMNPIATGLGRADLEDTIAARPDGYVIPKPRHATDVREVAQLLDALEPRHGIPSGTTRLVVIATETPEGLLNIHEIATATPRTVAISWGIEDLGAAMGLPRTRDADGRYLDIPRYARVMCAIAAAAAGVERATGGGGRAGAGRRRPGAGGAFGGGGAIRGPPRGVMRAMRVAAPAPIERAPLRAETIEPPEPGPDEILVRVHVCGVCRTD